MIGFVNASGAQTASAAHSRPEISYASRNTFRQTSAPMRHMKTIVAGHQRSSQDPTIQAGASTAASPGERWSYHSCGGRTVLARNANSGSGASMPT